MDRSTRSFLALVVVAVTVYAVLALATCALAAVAVERVVEGGFEALVTPGADLRPSLALWAVMAVAVSAAIRSLQRQLVATERVARRVRAHLDRPPPRVRRIAAELGLPGRIEVIDTADVLSFTYGFLRPRVVVTRGMLAVTDDDQLRAVLEHERYHVRQLDPLKSLATRTVPDALFFLPALRELRDRYLVDRELDADRQVVDRLGRAPLAGALYKTLQAPPNWQPAAGAAVGGFDVLPARLSQMEAGRQPPPTPISRTALTVSAVSGVVLTLMLASASGALPGGIADVHSQMMGAEQTRPVGAVGFLLCGALWVWIAWRIARWFHAVHK